MVIAFSMRATLTGVRPARFFKAARSCPGHSKASGNGFDVGALAIVARRFAQDVAEGAAEGAQTGEADVEADVRYAAVGLAEQEHRPFDPSTLKIAVGCLAEGRAEGADEVRLGDECDAGKSGNVE